jgi:MoaA/NifB/PqqE/SkfB family radical SAM enzyme
MSTRGPWLTQLGAAVRYPLARMAGYPVLVNLEVTRTCNARCDFCRYWTTKAESRLEDYAPVIRRLKPAAVVVTGGEPFMRRDLPSLVAGLRRACPWLYIGLVTNGALLTVPRARAVWEAGLDQLAVSLDFLDDRHDRARGIPGLARRIVSVLPGLRDAGIGNVSVNTVIKRDNLDAVPDVVRWALAEGLQVVVSAYTPIKSGRTSHVVGDDDLPRVRTLVDWLLALKAQGAGIVSSSYYLSQIPEYFRGGIGGCLAGRRFLTVSPAGEIQRCSESKVLCGYERWTPGLYGPTECRACWTSCRGESQAPLDWERIRHVAGVYSGKRPGFTRPEAPAHVPDAVAVAATRHTTGAA